MEKEVKEEKIERVTEQITKELNGIPVLKGINGEAKFGKVNIELIKRPDEYVYVYGIRFILCTNNTGDCPIKKVVNTISSNIVDAIDSTELMGRLANDANLELYQILINQIKGYYRIMVTYETKGDPESEDFYMAEFDEYLETNNTMLAFEDLAEWVRDRLSEDALDNYISRLIEEYHLDEKKFREALKKPLSNFFDMGEPDIMMDHYDRA